MDMDTTCRTTPSYSSQLHHSLIISSHKLSRAALLSKTVAINKREYEERNLRGPIHKTGGKHHQHMHNNNDKLGKNINSMKQHLSSFKLDVQEALEELNVEAHEDLSSSSSPSTTPSSSLSDESDQDSVPMQARDQLTLLDKATTKPERKTGEY